LQCSRKHLRVTGLLLSCKVHPMCTPAGSYGH
jgi:hypothetical protein